MQALGVHRSEASDAASHASGIRPSEPTDAPSRDAPAILAAAKAPIDSLPPNYMVEFDSTGFHLPRNALIQSVPANGAGNFFSTAQDIFRFGEALRTGTLVPLDDVSLMRAPKAEFGAPEYGYGVMRWLAPGVWGHAGGLPGVDADLEYFGDSGYMLVTLSNVDGVSGPIRRKAIAVLATTSYFRY